MRIDVPMAKKSLKSAKDSEKSEEKAQISLLLEEKGIKTSAERVNAIIGNEKRKDENENHRHSEQSKESEKKERLDIRRKQVKVSNEQSAVSNYAERSRTSDSEKLLDEKTPRSPLLISNSSFVKSYFDSVDSASLTHKNGLLSAFNTILSKNQKDSPLRHWISLPFEWDFQKSWGNIRLLFDSELKNLEKVVIDLKNSEKNNIFVLYYKGNEVDSVKFSSSDNLTSSKKSRLSKELASMFGKKIKVEAVDASELQGFCSGDEEISFVDGKV